MLSAKLVVLCFFSLSISKIHSKIFERCELARDLEYIYDLPADQIPTWVCIANFESHYNTSAHNIKSGDHGIFQINQRWWCNNTGPAGKACNAKCSQFRDNNIQDDVACIQIIYKEHRRISGNGFNAWVTYKKFCKGDVSRFTKGC